MAQVIDETGHQYGWLTVLERVANIGTRATWRCRCECGNIIDVAGVFLRNGTTRSCGCLQRKRAGETAVDETGRRYGRLVVVERAGSDEQGNALWLCQCDCGNKLITRGSGLRDGHMVSCGCRRDEMLHANTLPYGQAAINQLYGTYRNSARLRGLCWELSPEDFRWLTSQPCHYCGASPFQVCGDNGLNGQYVYNGLDRMNNDEGYTIENVVPCCGPCNRMKGTMSRMEFLELVKKISLYQTSGVSYIAS